MNKSTKQAYDGIFERAKQRDIIEVARDLGIELKPEGNGTYRGKSLLEAGKNDTCLCVYPESNSWFDFKTNTGGDVTDFVMYASTKSKIESAKWLVGDDEHDTYYYSERAIQLKTLENKYKEAHNRLKNDAETLEYLHKRGLTDEFLEAKCWGVADEWRAHDENGKSIFEKRLQIPYFDRFWRVIYGTSRCLPKHEYINPETGKALKYKQLSIGKNGSYSALYRPLLGLETIPHKHKERKTLVICEGCFDWASFAQEGYSVLGLSGGNIGQENKGEFFEICKSFERIILTFDNDKTAGENFTYNIGEKLLFDGILFDVVRDYGEGVKDVSDYYANGGDLRKLIDGAKNGYVFMAEKFSKDYPLKNVSFDARKANKERLTEFINKLRPIEEYDSDLFENVGRILINSYGEKAIKSATSKSEKQADIQCQYRDVFLNEHRLFSYGEDKSVSYYEYNSKGGEWKKTTTGFIKAEISRIIERYSKTYKPQFLNDIFELIKHKIALQEMPEFNKKPLWRFRNGYLNLDTGELYNPRPEDYISGGMRDYDYKPEATCPKIDKFLHDITGGEQSRINTIWKFIAYIFCPDNRLAQAPLFIGEEGSGKSTLMELIQAFVRDVDGKNVTNLQPKSMANPFTRSTVQHTLLNIADDVHKSLGKGLDYIKNAISGNSIDVERKFKENISIRPRGKWFLTANNLPSAETIAGFERRLIFIRIVGNFGVGKDGKEVNTNMLNELTEELSGMFNKAYAIYQEMRKAGFMKIEPCIDQAELMNDFIAMNNEVMQFIEDKISRYIFEPTLRKQSPEQLHESYKTWAKDLNRRELLTKKQFITELNRLINKKGIKGITKKHTYKGDFYFFENPEAQEAIQIEADETQVKETAKEPETVKTDERPNEATEEKILLDEKTKKLMELVLYRLSFDKDEFNRELRRVRGDFEAMLKFLRRMKSRQRDKWKIGQYQIVIDEIEKVA